LENKGKTISGFKKLKKILLRTLLGLVVFIVFVAIALSLPVVQTKIAHYASKELNTQFGTNINIDRVAITIFGSVKLKGVVVLDHHKDTLASADRLQTNVLSFVNIGNNKMEFSTLRAEKLNFHMKTYKGEKNSNLDVFVKKFDNGKPGDGSFRFRVGDLYVSNGRYRLTNENAVTPRVLDFKKLSGQVDDFYIKGSDITAGIARLSLLDHRGVFIENLVADFSLTKTSIKLEKLKMKTSESELEGAVRLSFKVGDMKDFVNKVQFDFPVTKAAISSNELNRFYPEFGPNQKYYLSTHLKGPMNNFVLHDLNLLDANDSEIMGTVNFQHLFNKEGGGFYMDGNFDRISSQYNTLRSIMPRILGKSLPQVLEKFGRVDLVGHVKLTKVDLETQLYIMSELGEAEANLAVHNYAKPAEAAYKGVIDLQNFNVGAVAGVATIGNATMHVDVDGHGFTQQSLNTIIKGQVTGFAFNGYNYKNIEVDGNLRWPYFKGRLNSNDPNLLMTFDGLVDMSQRIRQYDFHAQIDYADLALLKIMKKDTLSIFKGDLLFEASGTNLNDMAGSLQVSQLSYQNSRDSYYYEDFSLVSSFDENNVRTITLNSRDIIEGRMHGVFDVNQLPKIMENAAGSLYTNYSPHKVKKGQYLDFDFTVYNKVIEIFLPDVKLGPNTRLRGMVNADKGEFRMNFYSPTIDYGTNRINNIKVDVNNRNPLYNAYVSIDSLRMKNYKVSDFSILNVTQNDTMYLRSEFKGGQTQKDFYNLDLYHTIDNKGYSVVGFKKSEVNFKDYMWYINEDNATDNKIIFNKKLTDFNINDITLSHNNQKVDLSGIINGKDFKDLNLSFKDVDLHKITPSLDSINFGGRLNGSVSFKQDKDMYEPSAALTVDTLRLNKYTLGDMRLDVAGDKSLRRFNVNSTIERNGTETFSTRGSIDIVNKQTMLSLDAQFSEFDISPLTTFLKTVFPEIRGRATGRAAIVGTASHPEIDGILYMRGAGLKVGYLNTDYNFEENATVSLTEKEIIFGNIGLTDTRYKTTGRLTGKLKHDLFKNWELGLNISSDKMLVLDTEETEEALYYGTAFIKGNAALHGPTSGLVIDVDATSMPGTDMKILVNNSGAVSSTTAAYIHFLSPDEKKKLESGIVAPTKTYNGLELNFDLTVTPDANLEVIIDRNSGHMLKARGNGNLLLEINTLGKFNMWGDYSVTQGDYYFRYGGFIDKKFTAVKGGSIVWEGDPKRARLNIEAVYKTQANPSILLETATFNRNIPTEVTINLTGSLVAPEPDFYINFPGVSSVLKSDLDYRLSDANMRKTQALVLLASGGFVSNVSDGNSTLVTGSLLERAGSLLSDMFSDGKDGNINVNLNYTTGGRNPYAESTSQVNLALSSQINDRITVNGALGVPVGGVNESAIVGNVEVQVRLNDDNTLKARVFNRENDINFLGEGINYTQGVGLTYEVDFDTMTELLTKLFSKKPKEENKNNNSTDIPDSELMPDFIQFEDRKKKQEEPTPQERIPETD
jgi:TamB, inner membrane protein subunit of TAM complex